MEDFEQKRNMHRCEFQVTGRRWKMEGGSRPDAGTWERSSGHLSRKDTVRARPRQGQGDACGTERETEGLCGCLDDGGRKVSGSGNGWFTVTGLPEELPLRADGDFRLRYVVCSASGIEGWPCPGRNGIFWSKERLGLG